MGHKSLKALVFAPGVGDVLMEAAGKLGKQERKTKMLGLFAWGSPNTVGPGGAECLSTAPGIHFLFLGVLFSVPERPTQEGFSVCLKAPGSEEAI